MELALTSIMTLLVLGSIAIFLEDAVYLYKNTRCPIKRRSLLWNSSAPTVRPWGCPSGGTETKAETNVRIPLNSAAHFSEDFPATTR